MMQELFANPWPLWLALAGILLAAEMLGTSGYLLWSGVAALLVALLVWLVPLPWEWQGVSFALLTVLAALWWTRWLKYRGSNDTTPRVNQRSQEMVGKVLVLDSALVNGIGHVRIADGNWRVQADDDLPAGTRVTVIAIEGITLRVVPRLY